MSLPNVFRPEFDADMERSGFVRRRAAVGRQAGARDLGATLHVLEPGQTPHPYHLHFANEEMLVLLSGRLTVRRPSGTEEVQPGDVVLFPVGADGAHQVTGSGHEPAHFLMVSEMNRPDVLVFPDSGKVSAREEAPSPVPGEGLWLSFRQDDAVDHFEDESPPDR
jgi:uncharacterized cupin superfamily protein